VRAAGRIEIDERRVFAIAPKFEGWVERLFVNVTGQPGSMGQPLFEVFSPELVSAQREYAIASDAVKSLKDAGDDPQASMRRLADSSLARLKNWDISEEQVKALAQSGEARRTLTFRSPVSGIVMDKKAMQGMRFMTGDTLYQVADLSAVWVVADIFEQDIALVRTGSRAKVTISAYPGQVFEGTIAHVYPTLKPETRTVPVRLEIANPRQQLKPAMFTQIEIRHGRGQGPHRAEFRGHRRRHAPHRARATCGRTLRAARGELGSRGDKYVEVMEGHRWRTGGGLCQLPDRRRKQSQGGDQWIRPTGQAAHPTRRARRHNRRPRPRARRNCPAALAARSRQRPTRPRRRPQGGRNVTVIDAKSGTVSVAHGPIETLKWPAMTMDFKVANDGMLAGLKPGATIAFEFVERAPGEWVITKITPRGAAKISDANPAARQGR
jgi:Cu(I)/Ag(I) efflux system membrane fusion protein